MSKPLKTDIPKNPALTLDELIADLEKLRDDLPDDVKKSPVVRIQYTPDYSVGLRGVALNGESVELMDI
jgi:hypothetical protein